MIDRPRLTDAPTHVQDAVTTLLGSPIRTEQPATAGYTPAIASIITGDRGQRLFVKAAPSDDIHAGTLLAAAVGELSPRLLGHTTTGTWHIAAYEVIDGDTVTRWTTDDIPPLLDILNRMHQTLDPSPITGTTPYAEAFRPMLGAWHTPQHPLPVPIDIPVLAALESHWTEALADDTALHHGDLRRDNTIRQPDGHLRIVDWTHLWTAPGWMDLIRLAPDVAACGHDPEDLLRRSPWHDAPHHHVNTALAGLAGRAWRDGHQPGPPTLRHMQREHGHHLLSWLARRLDHPGSH
ncbi:aminoglycoside phosphotransferase family protein [Actinoplanes sp. L3-i22]|uniref:aminoglycoside phosphotransferase family protein n=1 Tax=Actinoplanes sp. L3-i22 TaxID=2836373 RepID=UPI001C78157F|nr:aminoglycoside phosphotransferase family protein [Actinoplanes sp. L3-i22]BCY10381.1 hypothetical protein L3i22_054690 [Actinoplanes sp. L3-i22]